MYEYVGYIALLTNTHRTNDVIRERVFLHTTDNLSRIKTDGIRNLCEDTNRILIACIELQM